MFSTHQPQWQIKFILKKNKIYIKRLCDGGLYGRAQCVKILCKSYRDIYF